MKKTKYIISFFAIFFGFLFIGESYQFYLNNFESGFYYTTLYLQDDKSEDEMKADILRVARNNNIEVFTIINNIESTFSQEIEIYGTKNIKSLLNKNYAIDEKKYESILTGETKVKFLKFEDIPDIEKQIEYYLIGEEKNIHSFKKELIEKYAGNFPKISGKSFNYQEIYGVWILISIVLILLSMYDVVYQKKENSIKISLGESVNLIMLKNIFIDLLTYTCIFGGSILILNTSTNVLFGINISIKMFVLFLLSNSILYTSLYFYNLREMLRGIKASRKLLVINYILKFVTIVIAIMCLAGNIAIIVEGYRFYKQKEFFEEHRAYSYVNLQYKMKQREDGSVEDNISKSMHIQEDFYNEFYNKFNALDLINISMTGLSNEVILSSKNMCTYLEKNIEELKNKKLSKDFYFLIPENLKENKNIVDEVNLTIKVHEARELDYTYDVIYYKGNKEIINIDEKSVNGSKLLKNPIIVLKNTMDRKLSYSDGKRSEKIINYRDVMYNILDKDFKEFLEKNNLIGERVSTTNVLEKYLHQLDIVKRAIFISLILSVLILFLELILIKTILMLEYEVNAIELSVKKVLGYSLFQKNIRIIGLTVGITGLSVAMAVVFGGILGISEGYYLLAGGILIGILELMVITFYIKKLEKAKLQKILKGGNL